MKTAGKFVCDNRKLFHPEAMPAEMIDLVRAIQVDALRHAAKLTNVSTPADRILAEADQIEKGTR